MHRDFLDELDRLGMRVTLFVETRKIDNRPAATALLREYVSRGHQFGSHTHTHVKLLYAAFEEARADIDEAHRVLAAATSRRVRHFRPPSLQLVPERTRTYLTNTMNYTIWGALNGAGSDWQEAWLPSANASLFARAAAQQLARHMRTRVPRCGAQAEGAKRSEVKESTSSIFTLHDRPHSLRWVSRYALEICKVCPMCEFRALPDEPRDVCVPPLSASKGSW